MTVIALPRRDVLVPFSKIIKAKFGVVDKFSGDCVLAFFPELFSGPDAAFLQSLGTQAIFSYEKSLVPAPAPGAGGVGLRKP